MTIKSRLRTAVEYWGGVHILKQLPRGVSLRNDMATFMPGFRISTIFDIGANVGQTVKEFRRDFPEAELYSFEPVPASFAALKKAVQGMERVQTRQLAFGRQRGVAKMLAISNLSDNRILDEKEIDQYNEVVEVEVQTIDSFMAEAGLDRVDFVKIDTEGMDLDVLYGAEKQLDANRIDVVQVEAGVNRDNTRHRHLVEFMDYMDSKSYLLFGLYEQIHNWRDQLPHLRRANAVFISPRLAEQETGTKSRK